MPELDDALVKLSSWLTENEIRHMVIGGFAVTVWGEPRTVELKQGSVPVCSPEDLILHKIVSERPRDHEDIEGVFRYRHAELDYGYLDPRVEELADALSDRNMLDWYRRLRQRWRTR